MANANRRKCAGALIEIINLFENRNLDVEKKEVSDERLEDNAQTNTLR